MSATDKLINLEAEFVGLIGKIEEEKYKSDNLLYLVHRLSKYLLTMHQIRDQVLELHTVEANNKVDKMYSYCEDVAKTIKEYLENKFGEL